MFQTRTISRMPSGLCPAEMAATLRLARPLALVALVNMGMSVTDTVMAAGFGVEALAAVAVASDAYSIVFYLAAGTLGAVAPLWAKMRAAGDAAGLARLEASGGLVAAVLAMLGVAVLWHAPGWLARMGLDAGLLAAGEGYARAMALTLAPMLGVVLWRQRLTAEGRPGMFLKVTLAALPLNAALNWVFMHGVGGWDGLGITGAGVSSLCVALGMLAALRLAAGRRQDAARREADREMVATILRTGVPIGIATVAEVGIFLGATLAIATLGAAEVAAHAIAIRVAGVIYAVPLALQQAATLRMGHAEGLASAGTRRDVIATGMAVGIAAGLALAIAVAGIAWPLAKAVFAEDYAAQAVAVTLLLLLAASQIAEPAGAVAAGLLRGRSDTRVPMLIVLCSFWGLSAPLGLWLMGPGGMGAVGAWTGLVAGSILVALATCARLPRHWPAV